MRRDRTDLTVLVVAKAPVAGRVKTRLAATTGYDAAADLAAAALLDTIAAVAATPGARGHLALSGDLAAARRADDLRRALAGWTVTPQVGDGFGERLVRAHADAGPGPVVQVGMDTPHVAPADLLDAAAALATHDATLGPAGDGGWWLLGRHDPGLAGVLAGVAMSTPRTCADTHAAIVGAGHRVALIGRLDDVDDATDAAAVARLAPRTHFAAAWRAWEASIQRAPDRAPDRVVRR